LVFSVGRVLAAGVFRIKEFGLGGGEAAKAPGDLDDAFGEGFFHGGEGVEVAV